ncbi:LysR family transcriptional regulator [Roseburia inulinivorans]|uniref:Cyn operon transcriptional activator n=1 Tax=Roseburia inulinivorans TaxID=360807 RepID=A0A174FEQ9_9FIRM|nr:LysR family transcriptional regulator [Roseburia inulinivorans]CUO48191.1 Cyn operon transcriptional activator [Roseburia inulinivorans]
MDKNVQYILEVAKCGGITKAANNLYITPSALSKFVQAREEELNVQLFHRIGKRFVLTAAGEYYVGRCKEIETIQKEITIQMERFSSMSHGMIRIGVQPSFSDLVLKDIIATVYKGNIIKNLIMDCQSYTKYRPNETTGGIFVSWRRKEELPTGA